MDEYEAAQGQAFWSLKSKSVKLQNASWLCEMVKAFKKHVHFLSVQGQNEIQGSWRDNCSREDSGSIPSIQVWANNQL